MGINLLSKSKLPISHYSSSINLCFFRRVFSEAAAHAPSTVVGDMKPNSSKPIMFLIAHVHERIKNYSLLSVAAENNKHHRICSPFSGRPAAKHYLVGSCKEWILFWSDTKVEYNHVGSFIEWIVFKLFGNTCHSYEGELTLWNPTTNRIKTLPPPLLPHRVFHIYDSFGFGFDPKSQDYKLIRRKHKKKMYPSEREFNIELYSLKTDSWKQITAPPDVHVNSYYFRRNRPVHINGVIYWDNPVAGKKIIRSFDFADEKFSEIPVPDTHSNYCLAEFHESLAMIFPYWVPNEDLTEEEKQQHMQRPFSIWIWVWNGETWNVGPRCAVVDFPVGYRNARPLGFFQNEYFFVQGYDETELMLFNCKTGKLENLGIQLDDPLKTSEAKVFPFPSF